MSLGSLYRRATKGERALGRAWYPTVRRGLHALSIAHQRPLPNVVCAFAALSPQLSYTANWKALHALIADPTLTAIPSVMKASIARAKLCLTCERPMDHLSGQKVRAFARAILGDPQSIVIDTWMLKILGEPPNADLRRNRRLAKLQARVRRAAKRQHITPRTFQATVWIVARGRAF